MDTLSLKKYFLSTNPNAVTREHFISNEEWSRIKRKFGLQHPGSLFTQEEWQGDFIDKSLYHYDSDDISLSNSTILALAARRVLSSNKTYLSKVFPLFVGCVNDPYTPVFCRYPSEEYEGHIIEIDIGFLKTIRDFINFYFLYIDNNILREHACISVNDTHDTSKYISFLKQLLSWAESARLPNQNGESYKSFFSIKENSRLSKKYPVHTILMRACEIIISHEISHHILGHMYEDDVDIQGFAKQPNILRENHTEISARYFSEYGAEEMDADCFGLLLFVGEEYLSDSPDIPESFFDKKKGFSIFNVLTALYATYLTPHIMGTQFIQEDHSYPPSEVRLFWLTALIQCCADHKNYTDLYELPSSDLDTFIMLIHIALGKDKHAEYLSNFLIRRIKNCYPNASKLLPDTQF